MDLPPVLVGILTLALWICQRDSEIAGEVLTQALWVEKYTDCAIMTVILHNWSKSDF